MGMFELFEQEGLLDEIIALLLRLQVDAMHKFKGNDAVAEDIMLCSVDAPKGATGDFI